LMLNVQSILSTLADTIYSAWIPLFLFQVHKLKFAEMGVYSALPLLGGAVGGAMGGWLNDWMIRRTGNRRWSRSLVGLAGKGTAGVLLLLAMLAYDQPRLFCGLLFFVKLFSDWSLTTSWGTVTDIGGRTSATVFAFNNSVAGVGSILGPVIFGAIAEFRGWPLVFFTAAGTYLLCAASWLAIDCTRPVVDEDQD
jgi:MFS transporter, ACS family, glucarate transporter